MIETKTRETSDFSAPITWVEVMGGELLNTYYSLLPDAISNGLI